MHLEMLKIMEIIIINRRRYNYLIICYFTLFYVKYIELMLYRTLVIFVLNIDTVNLKYNAKSMQIIILKLLMPLVNQYFQYSNLMHFNL